MDSLRPPSTGDDPDIDTSTRAGRLRDLDVRRVIMRCLRGKFEFPVW